MEVKKQKNKKQLFSALLKLEGHQSCCRGLGFNSDKVIDVRLNASVLSFKVMIKIGGKGVVVPVSFIV